MAVSIDMYVMASVMGRQSRESVLGLEHSPAQDCTDEAQASHHLSPHALPIALQHALGHFVHEIDMLVQQASASVSGSLGSDCAILATAVAIGVKVQSVNLWCLAVIRMGAGHGKPIDDCTERLLVTVTEAGDSGQCQINSHLEQWLNVVMDGDGGRSA
jgi:hypothetical protein